MKKFRTLDDIGDIYGKRIIVRGNLDVPIENSQVIDPERIEVTLETVNELKEKGAKVILVGHTGRDPEATLEPVKRYLQHYMPVVFVEDFHKKEETLKTIEQLAPGSLIIFENLRRWKEEKDNNKNFAELLASYGDFYVNEAFSNSHREHASMVSVPKLLPSFAGRELNREIENLSKFFKPEHPFVFILGGAKVETKLPLINSFIDKADILFLGGVLANDFFKAKGLEVGKSVVSELVPDKELLENKNIILPEDVAVLRGKKKIVIKANAVQKEDFIYDIGPKSAMKIMNEIKKAKFVLWNGPLGYCEGGFCAGTVSTAKTISNSKAFSVIGGGDTLASVSDDFEDRISFVSIGGGAMLEFLAKKELPAVEVLKN
jgi:phosphoglycerate kinase